MSHDKYTHWLISKAESFGLRLSLVFVLLLLGCSAPDEQQLAHDLKEVIFKEAGGKLQPIIISVISGEGDSDNVYKHIRFDAVATEDGIVHKGWFAGMSLRKGQRLSGGEVVLLYQKNKGSQWKMTRYDLKRKPSQ